MEEGRCNDRRKDLSGLLDIELEANIRFGAREMSLAELLEIGPGAVIPLDRQVTGSGGPDHRREGGRPRRGCADPGQIRAAGHRGPLRVTQILATTKTESTADRSYASLDGGLRQSGSAKLAGCSSFAAARSRALRASGRAARLHGADRRRCGPQPDRKLGAGSAARPLRMPLGLILLSRGWITHRELQEALAGAAQRRARVASASG